MKPKPLESLNHFTVPVAIYSFLLPNAATNPGATKPGMTIKEGNRRTLRRYCDGEGAKFSLPENRCERQYSIRAVQQDYHRAMTDLSAIVTSAFWRVNPP